MQKVLFFASSFWQCLCTEPEFRLCWMKFDNSDNHYTNFKIRRISKDNLKVVSATFLLACFVCLKEITCETRKSAFYFTSKDLLVLEIINFQHFRYSNMTSSNPQAWNTKYILVNNLGSKHSLVMKFGQFMQYYNIIFFIEKLYEKCHLETSSRPFLIFKESSVKKFCGQHADLDKFW